MSSDKFTGWPKRLMKILLISPSQGRYGGLEGFVIALSKAIRSDPDFELKVLFKETAAFCLGDDLKFQIHESGLPVAYCARASGQLFRAIRNADLVHVQNPCPDVVLLARMLRKPLLINVINHQKGGDSVHERLWRFCLKLADRRIYISEFVRLTWEKASRPWQGSSVVYPVCDLAPMDPVPVSQRRGFVFVGRWIENKGLDTLVQAYARAGLAPEQWPLQLLGDGPLRPRITSLVRELGLGGVEMPGFISEVEKGQRMRQSRFAVVPPNTREDFGLVAIEARHLGVPCLITRDGGLPEAAGEHSLQCEPADVDGLCELLRQAAAMPEDAYGRLANAAQTSLKAEMAHPGYYHDVYRSMLGTRGSPGAIVMGVHV